MGHKKYLYALLVGHHYTRCANSYKSQFSDISLSWYILGMNMF